MTVRAGMNVLIRRAELTERAVLAALAFRSKAAWGYDAAFMESVRDVLTPSEDYVASGRVYVAERDGVVLAFYGLLYEGEQLWLYDMFVAPDAMRTGIGRMLWEHALGTAAAEDVTEFFIESDPYAEGFYRAMGASPAGERVAAGSGRRLPVLRAACVR